MPVKDRHSRRSNREPDNGRHGGPASSLLTRRRAISSLLALTAAAGATISPRLAHPQATTAPIGDSAPLADLGMPLSAETTRGGHFLSPALSFG